MPDISLDEKATTFFKRLETQQLNVFQASMLPLGCYGYEYNNCKHNGKHNKNSTFVILEDKNI
jgi:hypothetical protein